MFYLSFKIFIEVFTRCKFKHGNVYEMSTIMFDKCSENIVQCFSKTSQHL